MYLVAAAIAINPCDVERVSFTQYLCRPGHDIALRYGIVMFQIVPWSCRNFPT